MYKHSTLNTSPKALLVSALFILVSVYLSCVPKVFAAEKSEYLWLSTEQKTALREELGMRHLPIRFKYEINADESRTWLLSEYGKEQLIDFKVEVEHAAITHFEVLKYRESYGGEISFKSFRQQFIGNALQTHDSFQSLEQDIDGISGATISVNSSERIAKLALWLDSQVDAKD